MELVALPRLSKIKPIARSSHSCQVMYCACSKTQDLAHVLTYELANDESTAIDSGDYPIELGEKSGTISIPVGESRGQVTCLQITTTIKKDLKNEK
jgi:hypothetical protein